MEYKRKAILARDIKNLSLTQVREQAKSLGLLDNKKYNAFLKTEGLLDQNIPKVSENSDEQNIENNL